MLQKYSVENGRLVQNAPGFPRICVYNRPDETERRYLIDQCGLKGYSVGEAQVSMKHAGFLVNNNGTSSRDYLTLMQKVQQIVLERAGVQLEPEVKVIGEEPKEA